MAPAKRKSTDGPGSAQKPKIQKALQQSGGKVASVPLDGLVGQVTAWFLGAANCCPLPPLRLEEKVIPLGGVEAYMLATYETEATCYERIS